MGEEGGRVRGTNSGGRGRLYIYFCFGNGLICPRTRAAPRDSRHAAGCPGNFHSVPLAAAMELSRRPRRLSLLKRSVGQDSCYVRVVAGCAV